MSICIAAIRPVQWDPSSCSSFADHISLGSLSEEQKMKGTFENAYIP